MAFLKVTSTLTSRDEILRCDHSNETSSVVLSHCAICFSKFQKKKFENFARNLLWAKSGSERLKSIVYYPLKSQE